MAFDRSSNVRFFAAKTPNRLSEKFVGLSALGIELMPEILPRLHNGLFHREDCGFSHLSVQSRISRPPYAPLGPMLLQQPEIQSHRHVFLSLALPNKSTALQIEI